MSICNGRCGWEGVGKVSGEEVVVVVRGAFVKCLKAVVSKQCELYTDKDTDMIYGTGVDQA